jgi:hypothetical protein
VWKFLVSLGRSCRRPEGRAPDRNEQAIRHWKKAIRPDIKKTKKHRRPIVFLDESGLGQRPHRRRTWSHRSRTPALQYRFNWKTISVVESITPWSFSFRTYPEAIRAPHSVAFFKQLLRHIPGNLLLM